MKVCFQVEGTSDLLALRTIVELALGAEVDPIEYRRRGGGVTEVLKTLEPCLWQAWSLGCVGAVVGVDANGSTRHDNHDPSSPEDCRHCRIVRELPTLRPRYSQPDLAFAIAVPVEAIEAWLIGLRDRDKAPSKRLAHRLPRQQAKELLWGTRAPDGRTVATICNDILGGLTATNLDALATDQPSFASFLSDLRSWPRETPTT